MAEKKVGWGISLLWGAVMVPLAMFFIYLLVGFLPESLERTVKVFFNKHLLFSSLIFYAAGVLLFRWINLDLRKKEDWPDN